MEAPRAAPACRRPVNLRSTMRYAATKQTTTFAAVAISAIDTLFMIGFHSCSLGNESPIIVECVRRRQHLRGPHTIHRERHEYHHQVRQDEHYHEHGREDAGGDPALSSNLMTRLVADPLPDEVYFRFRSSHLYKHQTRHRAQREHRRLDVSEPHRAIELRRNDLSRQHANAAAEHVRCGERSE